MDMKSTRQKRLKELTDKRGEKKRLAEDSGLNPSQITSWLSGAKKMSENSARLIEQVRNLPNGWMDSDNMDLSFDSPQMDNHVYIVSFEFFSGQVDREIRFMSVSSAWLTSEGHSRDDVVSIEMPDDSQYGIVSRGFEVAINTNWGKKLKNNRYYAVRFGDSPPTVRRVEIQFNDDVLLKSINPDYTDQLVPANQVHELNIVGEAIKFQGVFPK